MRDNDSKARITQKQEASSGPTPALKVGGSGGNVVASGIPVAAGAPPASKPEVTAVFKGALKQLTEEGVELAMEKPPNLGLGTGVSLRFRLPTGVGINVHCVVKGVRSSVTLPGTAGVVVEFLGLQRTVEYEIRRFLRTMPIWREAIFADMTILERYTVSLVENGWLLIRLFGYLKPSEAVALGQVIDEIMSVLRQDRLIIWLDVSHFAACPEDSLQALTVSLAKLTRHGSVLGVVVGKGSVGMLQFRRLTREAGLAESLICFENDKEAASFLQAAAKEPYA